MTAAGLALAAALCFAVSTVAQHRAASRSPRANGLGLGLLWRLTRDPLWLLGVLAGAAALALQALALTVGQLVVVQPVLVTGMLFAIPASVLIDHRRPRLREWVWAAVVVAGLGLFLLAANPSAGDRIAASGRLLTATLVAAAVLVVAVVAALGVGTRQRAWLLGLAAGVAFGVTSVLLKQVVGQLVTTPRHLLASWPAYGLVLAGLAGVALAQLSYQAGSLAASQPALTIAEPLVAVLLGWSAFSEELARSIPARAGQLVGFALLATAVLRLALLTQAPPVTPDRTTARPSERSS